MRKNYIAEFDIEKNGLDKDFILKNHNTMML